MHRKLIDSFWVYMLSESHKLYFWAKSGESGWTALPTIFWAVGTIALAYRLVSAIFRRFVFRRIPLWEQILQQLLFLWIVIYSLHFWTVLVRVIKAVVDYYITDLKSDVNEGEISHSGDLSTQCLIWIFGVTPLAIYIHTRPRRIAPPFMIWITTSPWQRREMGPYGYYLNRPLSNELTETSVESQKTVVMRRAYSDSRIMNKEPFKKRRYSKSR